MSVARAVLEHCADKRKLGAKTMFATHYHELTALENEIEGVRNFNISAKKRGDDIIFLRKIIPGGADDSYGIEVAKLAGVPESVTKRAKTVLKELEGVDRGTGTLSTFQQEKVDKVPVPLSTPQDQISLLDMSGNEIASILGATDINTMTPLEALNLLFELKKKI
jgi:DNA mismatch repair protein MutS